MPEQYELKPLTESQITGWDELITGFEGRELFHLSPWLNYLQAAFGAQIRRWEIREASETVGYFCGGVIRKGPFRLLGSPLKSWGTNWMGPVRRSGFDQVKFLDAVESMANSEGLSMLEIEFQGLAGPEWQTAKFEPESFSHPTYIVSLSNPEDAMWKGLDSTCRNRVRKAIKFGLTIEEADDEGVADDFYNLYIQVMQRKGLKPPYPREQPRLLFRHLHKAGLLFALRVRDENGKILAAGLYPHDDRTMYFWGGASMEDGRDLCPNEFLHWSAMQLAASRGITTYNMCGEGRFKKKFGGVLTARQRWFKCYSLAATWSRNLYWLYFTEGPRLQRRVHRWLKGKNKAQQAALSGSGATKS